MNKEETLKILTVIKVAFPNSYKNLSETDLKATVALWQAQFNDYSLDLVSNAVNSYIASDLSGYSPTIAQIKNIALRLQKGNGRSDEEIWQPIYKAISNSLYNSKEEYDNLPDDLKKITSSRELRDYAMLESSTMSFIRNQLIKEYRSQEQRQTEFNLLPNKAKQMMIESKGTNNGIN